MSTPLCLLFFLFPALVLTKENVLSVPFTPQAPTGLWEEPWLNACEETAISMVNAYYSDTSIDTEQAVRTIEYILENKERIVGKSKDESLETIQTLVRKLYPWDAKIRQQITLSDIKKEIDAKRPVIAPIDATKVHNPAYGDPPPTYHVVIIVGYNDTTQEFIVHDPGITAGDSFHYQYTDLLDANAAYTISDTGEQRGGDVLFTSPSGHQWIHHLWDWARKQFQLIFSRGQV